eukprot:GDKH01000076.1.p2 GENE.GDKH01000076.1~~GDKH01000076.1.p2  ORF type:complete len:79 (-),score=21.74 GDKH01000076.1:137-373(-)
MGRTNACRSAQKRDRAAANAPKDPKSQLKSNQQAMNITCNICRQPFMNTQNRMQLQGHVDSKHSKSTFDDCFPGYSGP